MRGDQCLESRTGIHISRQELVQRFPQHQAVIEQLIPLLEPDDIIIDGGNSFYKATERRDAYLSGKGLRFIGAGVSGFRELGIAREKSGVALREAVEVIRQLLAGERVTYKGSVVQVDGAHLDFKPVRADVPMYIASQRPVGCRSAGRVADGAIMQGCVAEPLLAFFRDTVAAGAREAGRDPAVIDLVARINVCVHDDRRAARNLMKPTIVRSLAAQRPDFFTFETAGVTVPPALAKHLESLTYAYDPRPFHAAAADVPEAFVDAVTLAGPPDEVAAGVVRLGQHGITQFMLYPMSPDGRIETTIERFQSEVMPHVRAAGL